MEAHLKKKVQVRSIIIVNTVY